MWAVSVPKIHLLLLISRSTGHLPGTAAAGENEGGIRGPSQGRLHHHVRPRRAGSPQKLPDMVSFIRPQNTLSMWALSLFAVCVIHRNLEKFWGASGSFFTSVWGLVYRAHGENEFILWGLGKSECWCLLQCGVKLKLKPVSLGDVCTGPWFMSNAVFILANVFFTFVDLTAWPKFMLRYKIQEDKNVPVRLQWCQLSICLLRLAIYVPCS